MSHPNNAYPGRGNYPQAPRHQQFPARGNYQQGARPPQVGVPPRHGNYQQGPPPTPEAEAWCCVAVLGLLCCCCLYDKCCS
ncbi:hypothetical protein AALP_AA7G203200 [Arabis alpina]|uniref:Cysteine-rich transmembrane CYSTM domain-containing protein n=1 Tax=Arabis alpina TaxID=50452 RepID=A0A087GJD6_ARAAL|nr:hypothetical protein AALP_AA7G203200 [Arabis alpina]